MAKVHPLFTPETRDDSITSTTTTSCSDNKYMTSKRATFTVWMKSLVMQGNGCTAFDENGDIVYRIDNYDDKRSREVYLMDLRGKLLFTILEDRTLGIPSWKGYRGGDSDDNKALFQVRKTWGSILGDKHKECLYKVTMRSETNWYVLEVVGGKSAALRIRDGNGGVVAEAKRKESSTGVVLGNDVLRLVVEPHVDQSFIMALVTVYGLIRHQI